MEWIVQLPILFFSVMVHEVSHGVVALRNGDDTARRAGRLTFNPLPHVDLFGTILLPVMCLASHMPLIGWAKPVPVDPTHIFNPRWGLFRVALIGPLSNIALSFLAAVLFRLVAFLPAFHPGFQHTLLNVLTFAVSINLFLAFFNLIPIYPLDGSKVLGNLLPAGARAKYYRHARFGFLMILALMYFGVLKIIVLIPAVATMLLYQKLGLIW